MLTGVDEAASLGSQDSSRELAAIWVQAVMPHERIGEWLQQTVQRAAANRLNGPREAVNRDTTREPKPQRRIWLKVGVSAAPTNGSALIYTVR